VEDPITMTRHGPVGVLTINRPESRNDISDVAFVEAFEALCAAISRDEELAAIVITGAGKAFSSGGNIKMMQRREGMFAGDPAAVREGYRSVIQRIPRFFFELELPTIAAVNGPAIGAGCDLALMCDIRLASEKASFAESFLRAGLIPGDGGAWLLPRVVGLSRANEMIFTGDAIDAQTALAWGMVSRVVPADELVDQAIALGHRIAQNVPRTLRLAKRLIRDGMSSKLDAHLELSAAFQALCHHMPEHEASLDALLNRKS